MQVYNPGQGPVVIDDEGRIIGGGESHRVKMTEHVERALDEGRLVDRTSKKTATKTDTTSDQPESED